MAVFGAGADGCGRCGVSWHPRQSFR